MGFNKPKLESKKLGAKIPVIEPGIKLPGRETKQIGVVGFIKKAYTRLNEATGEAQPSEQSTIQSLPRGVVEAYAYVYARHMVK